MYFHRFEIKNYLIHENTSVDLLPVTVFVGSNGAGKSAFFDALLNFSMLSRGRIQQAFGPYPFSYNATLYRGAMRNISRIAFVATMSKTEKDTEKFTYEVSYQQGQGGNGVQIPQYTIFQEKLTRDRDNRTLFDRSSPSDYDITSNIELEQDRCLFSAIRLASSKERSFDADLEYLTRQISRINKFRLDPFTLASACRIPEIVSDVQSSMVIPRLGYNGEELASTLYYLENTQAQELENIKELIRDLVPEFVDFEFNTVGTDRIAFALRYSDQRGSIPAVRLSSGMLTFIGLIALVSTPNRPPLIMIEEPENGLTPQAIKVLYGAIRKLAFNPDDESRSQILISSHSPFVICDVWNGEDRDFIHQVRVKDGKSRVMKFSEIIEHQSMHLGKDSEGERNILSLKNAEEIMSGRMAM